MLTRWQGGSAAVIVTLIAAGLVIGDFTDRALRRWWDGHALTTDTVAGLLVLLFTVLVADQLVRRRQLSDRTRAIAAQAAIIVGQAGRSARVVSGALLGSGDRDTAQDELRTYMLMLLVSAPVLIDATVSRELLELAQGLGGEMAWALRATGASGRGQQHSPPSTLAARIDEIFGRLRTASEPLLKVLDLDELIAAGDTQGTAGDGQLAAGDAHGNVSASLHNGAESLSEDDPESV